MSRLTRPQAVVYDWDGTLVNCWPTIHAALNVTLKAMGHEPWTYEETLVRVRKSMRDSFPELFGDRWEEAGRIFYDHINENHLKRIEIKPGAEELLRLLAAQGVYQSVVSNKQGALLRAEIAHLGWAGYFPTAIGAGDAPHDKPAPDPMNMALAGSGINTGNGVWYVGDTEIDMEFAAASKCVPVLVRESPLSAELLNNIEPAAYVRTCNELVSRITLL